MIQELITALSAQCFSYFDLLAVAGAGFAIGLEAELFKTLTKKHHNKKGVKKHERF